MYSPCRSSAEPNARCRRPALTSPGLVTRSRFSSVTGNGNTGPFGIHQVFLDTLERRRLTQARLGPGDWRFEVSPDGNTLAFIRYERDGNRGPVRRTDARRRTAAAIELERRPLAGYRGRPMVERLSTRSRSRQLVVCGESPRTAPNPVEDRLLPTSPRPL